MKIENYLNREKKVAVVGLGYVGLPLAVSFSKKIDVVGYDYNSEKVSLYKNGVDPTNEVGNEGVRDCSVMFTSDEKGLDNIDCYVVAVPTPVQKNKIPDLTPLESASKLVGKHLSKGSVVVFESTVFPGATEEICGSILEKESGLKLGSDFKIAYSPERINPGDKVHRLETIVKIVSGMDSETLTFVSDLYKLIIDAGVYEAESIKVAEAAKVIENSQRDINIGFMNELAMIFDRMDIDTRSVLAAAGTKWNFLNFEPGLVGGHCIGVDPYYLTYKAQEFGYHPQIILSGREVNDGMGQFIVSKLLKMLIIADKNVKKSKVAILGFTFKENCPDTRNTRVIDIIEELNEYGIEPLVYDPRASSEEVFEEYGVSMCKESELTNLDAVILAVKHTEFENISTTDLLNMKNGDETLIIQDLKGIFDIDTFEDKKVSYWRL